MSTASNEGDRIAMSLRERDRLRVLHSVLEGQRTRVEAARLLKRTRPANRVGACRGLKGDQPADRKGSAGFAMPRLARLAYPVAEGAASALFARSRSQRSGSQSINCSAVGFSPNANNAGNASRR